MAKLKIGILSDIHANLPALQVVLAYLASKSVDAIWCLGDVVGYGPYPQECVAALSVYPLPLVQIDGNHECLVTGRHDSGQYSDSAKASLAWLQSQLPAEDLQKRPSKLGLVFDPRDGWRQAVEARVVVEQKPTTRVLSWRSRGLVRRFGDLAQYALLTGKVEPVFLTGCPTQQATRLVQRQLPGESPLVQLVHASLVGDSATEYLLPTAKEECVRQNFNGMAAGVCFFGHTHQPTHHWVDASGVHSASLILGDPVVFNPSVDLQNGVKRMLNPGSVGQPRDGDPRAACGILVISGDPNSTESRWVFTVSRKVYDIDQVVARFGELGLDEKNGQRLYGGR